MLPMKLLKTGCVPNHKAPGFDLLPHIYSVFAMIFRQLRLTD